MFHHENFQHLEQRIANLSARWLEQEDHHALRVLVIGLKGFIVTPGRSITPEKTDLARSSLVALFGASHARGLRLLDPVALDLEEVLLKHDGWRECTPDSDCAYALADLLSKFIRGLGIDGNQHEQYLRDVSVLVSNWSGTPVQFTKEDDVDELHHSLFGEAWATLCASEIEDALDNPYADYLRILKPPFIIGRAPTPAHNTLPNNLTL